MEEATPEKKIRDGSGVDQFVAVPVLLQTNKNDPLY
jgi:hypothetical protein